MEVLNLMVDVAGKILFDPIKMMGVDHLCILSTHATPTMASWLLESYIEQNISGVSVELIVCTTVDDGISFAYHDAFKKMHGNRNSNNGWDFTCSYVHNKSILQNNRNMYIWLKENIPVCAFSGELEFNQSSFCQNSYKTITECDVSEAYDFFEEAVKYSVYCTYSEIEEEIKIYQSPVSAKIFENNQNKVTLSLFKSKSMETGERSGLNWGQRGKRNRNEAYIPLPASVAKSGFFPLNKQHFIAFTDDHCSLLLRVEQKNDKAITTPASNAQLGEYFRKRLNLGNGAFVCAEDLFAYGRTDVTFYKIDEEQFYMDFSVEKGI